MDTRSNDNTPPKARGNALSNQLLAALGPESRSRIDPHLQPVTLKLGAVVCEAAGLLKHAYFPQGSVLSLLTVLKDGAAIETANIGREGAFGLFAAMYSRVSFNHVLFNARSNCCDRNSSTANTWLQLAGFIRYHRGRIENSRSS